MIPPGIDLSRITPAPPSDRARPVILHAPSSRRRKGTEHVIAAVEGLDADLEIVEGLHHDEAFERFRNADIVVDQLNAGWYGLFAIECMALGKPVVTFLHDEAVRRTEEAFGTTVPIVSATAETLREQLAPARRRRGRATARRSGVARLRRARPRPGADHRPPPRRLRSTLMALSGQLKRLGKHSAIYGLGGLVSRILAVLLLPLYTHYLSTSDYGQVETLDRARHRAHDRAPVRDLVGVLPLLLRRRRPRRPPARAAHVVLVHDDDGDARARRARRVRDPDRRVAVRRRGRCEPRPGERGRALGAAELHAADEPLPGRGALGRVRAREPLERPAHGRRDAAARRRARQGAARRDRRQLHRHAGRLPRAARLPARAARAPARAGRCSGG